MPFLHKTYCILSYLGIYITTYLTFVFWRAFTLSVSQKILPIKLYLIVLNFVSKGAIYKRHHFKCIYLQLREPNVFYRMF